MRRKKSFWALGLALAVVPVMSTQLLAAEPAIKLEYCNTMATLITNTIGNKLKITNTSGQVINLEDLKIRYYYTVDEPLGQTLWCDHAEITGSNGYETITSLITHNFVNMNVPTETADTYAEIGFKEGISQLIPNGNAEIQLRFTNSSWKNYNQGNDYSYEDTENSYMESDRVCVYYQDVLISGTEPRNEGGAVDTTDYDFAMVVNGVNLTAGEEKVIPVMIKNIPSGINNANFILNYNQEALEVEAVSAGEVVPNEGESFKYAVHKDLGTINVLFADAGQQGMGLMSGSGEFMKIKVRAKKDFNGAPFNVTSKSDFADYDLKKLNIIFKEN